MSHTLRLICVGTDSQLLESRRLLLQSAGFEPTCVNPLEAAKLLRTSVFDAMIISLSVSEKDRATLKSAAPEHMRVIQLLSFTAPEELLALLRTQIPV